MACRGSRIKASLEALRDGLATPFLCHMGFPCVAAPVFPDTAQGFIITFGPYCPAEAPDTLTEDARRGLIALGDDEPGALAGLLRDIRLVHSDVVPVIVDWTVRDLNALWQRRQAMAFPEEAEAEPPPPARRSRARDMPEADPLRAAAVAAGLAGGEQREVRSLVLTVLSESPAGKRTALAARRARAVALVGAVIEAAERAKFDAQDCWGRLPEFIGMVSTARTNAELATAVTGVLRVIRRRAKQAAKDASLEALNNALLPRLGGAVTLNEIAAELGEPPSTITRRLQRKFGMSFSEYAGKQRVDRAKRLLRTTRLFPGALASTIQAISRSCSAGLKAVPLRPTANGSERSHDTDRQAAALVARKAVSHGVPVRSLQVRPSVRVRASRTSERRKMPGLPAQGQLGRYRIGVTAP